MRAGYPHWRCVTSDTAGVPTGGRYGRVRYFERRLNRVGLKLAWSRLHCGFGVYSQQGPGQYIWHMNLWRRHPATRRTIPMPLDDSLVFLLLHVWHKHCRMSAATIKQGLKQIALDYVHEIKRLRREAATDPEVVRDVANENWRASGRETRPAFSVGRDPLGKHGLGTMDN